jgi:hypothetical protein
MKNRPTCPFCHAPMKVVLYQGYYDSFHYWECDCKDDVLKRYVEEVWQGFCV